MIDWRMVRFRLDRTKNGEFIRIVRRHDEIGSREMEKLHSDQLMILQMIITHMINLEDNARQRESRLRTIYL